MHIVYNFVIFPPAKFWSWKYLSRIQYIPRNMHTVFALLCFLVVIHWLIFPYPSGLLHWHCGNLTIALVPAKQPWWIWINTSCEFIMNDCITTTKQSTTKPCAYFLGYTVIPSWKYLHGRLPTLIIPQTHHDTERTRKHYSNSICHSQIYQYCCNLLIAEWNRPKFVVKVQNCCGVISLACYRPFILMNIGCVTSMCGLPRWGLSYG